MTTDARRDDSGEVSRKSAGASGPSKLAEEEREELGARLEVWEQDGGMLESSAHEAIEQYVESLLAARLTASTESLGVARDLLGRVVVHRGAGDWTEDQMRDWCCEYKDFMQGAPAAWIRKPHDRCRHRERSAAETNTSECKGSAESVADRQGDKQPTQTPSGDQHPFRMTEEQREGLWGRVFLWQDTKVCGEPRLAVATKVDAFVEALVTAEIGKRFEARDSRIAALEDRMATNEMVDEMQHNSNLKAILRLDALEHNGGGLERNAEPRAGECPSPAAPASDPFAGIERPGALDRAWLPEMFESGDDDTTDLARVANHERLYALALETRLREMAAERDRLEADLARCREAAKLAVKIGREKPHISESDALTDAGFERPCSPSAGNTNTETVTGPGKSGNSEALRPLERVRPGDSSQPPSGTGFRMSTEQRRELEEHLRGWRDYRTAAYEIAGWIESLVAAEVAGRVPRAVAERAIGNALIRHPAYWTRQFVTDCLSAAERETSDTERAKGE